MRKRNRKPKRVRITHTPELFIFRRNGHWYLVNSKNKVQGIYNTKTDAKNAAIEIARKSLIVPRDYIEKYEHKLAGYEFLYKDMMGIKDDN